MFRRFIYLGMFAVLPVQANEIDLSAICEQSIAGVTRHDTVQTGIEKLSTQFSYDGGSGEVKKGKRLLHKLQYSNFDQNFQKYKYKDADANVRVLYERDEVYSITSTTYLMAHSNNFSKWPAKYKKFVEAKMAAICNKSHVKDHANKIGCSKEKSGPLIEAKVSISKPGEKKIACIYRMTTGLVRHTDNLTEAIYRLNESISIKRSLQLNSPAKR